MPKPAARVLDLTTHLAPALPGIGSPNVLIGGQPAWRTIIDQHICAIPIAPPFPAPHGPERCYLGSTTVLINFQMACRMGDILQGLGPPNPFLLGMMTVHIGDLGFGLASAPNMSRYATAMRALFKNWASMTANQRLAAMQAALNSALPPGMPQLTLQPAALSATTWGQLDFANWQVQVNQAMLQGPMTEDRFANVTNTIYHETRHGEQWWNVAQHQAANGTPANTIASNMGIPQSVATAAASNPAPTGTSQGAMGEAVNDSVYGSRSAYRESVLSDPTNQYQEYRALPEEEDAWRQGDAAEQAFRNTP
jgi:uncharacterized Zn-binding protein involved in type VI secretion